MKTLKQQIIRISVAMALLVVFTAQAQQPELSNFRDPGQKGLNVFETPKGDLPEFDGLKVRVGGDFALQFQGISQDNDLVGDTLVELANNFNLPTANLNIDVQLAKGVRMHMRTYLSSRHHTEAYVKGGFLQIDDLDFISTGLLSNVMNVTTLRFGMDEINYGDAHFRRSDNARAIYNPFVGNYLMDAFTTEPFAEVTVQKSGLIVVGGITNGRLNQSPVKGDDGFVVYGKLGYDNQISDDLRLRLTGSFYSSNDKGTRDYLYGGDRAGARYYKVLEGINDARPSDFNPRFNPGFKYQTSFQINPFVKFKGAEFFGIFETASNGDSNTGGSFTQLGAEVLYRFGSTEQFYLGGRFNSVSGESTKTASTIDISRLNIGGGWYLTNNILTKVEYITQEHTGDGYLGGKFQGAQFNGVVVEAAISF